MSSCEACAFRKVKHILKCDGVLPDKFRFCTQLAQENFKALCPKEGKALEDRNKKIINSSWGPNDANFE